jgi:hypothetical protein
MSVGCGETSGGDGEEQRRIAVTVEDGVRHECVGNWVGSISTVPKTQFKLESS